LLARLQPVTAETRFERQMLSSVTQHLPEHQPTFARTGGCMRPRSSRNEASSRSLAKTWAATTRSTKCWGEPRSTAGCRSRSTCSW
jgi:hypothetical protein